MLSLWKSKTELSQRKILLVDDEPQYLSTIQRRLEDSDFMVITAANGEEGFEQVAREKPDLIVLDVNMPIMNGHEMLRRLRADPNLKDVPVIMCTGCSEMQDIAAAASYNIADYVTKPFNCSELAEKIMNVLEDQGK